MRNEISRLVSVRFLAENEQIKPLL